MFFFRIILYGMIVDIFVLVFGFDVNWIWCERNSVVGILVKYVFSCWGNFCDYYLIFYNLMIISVFFKWKLYCRSCLIVIGKKILWYNIWLIFLKGVVVIFIL